MKLRTACIYTILSAALPLYAQENSNGKEWTLQECINYALEKTSNCNKTRFRYKKAK